MNGETCSSHGGISFARGHGAFLPTPALRRRLTGVLHAAHAQVVDRQGAAGIRRLCAQWHGAEGVALCGAGDAHLVTLPVNLQHARGYIVCQRIAAVGAGCTF